MIQAKVVADSANLKGDRVTSLVITFPRIILAEVNTHRMLSKCTASSRAIPFHKMVETINRDPFIPMAWQREHKGMQGNEYLDPLDEKIAITQWLVAKDDAIKNAEALGNSLTYVTKQLRNRLLEPFMWVTMLITGSQEGWNNFFKLRCPIYGDSAYGLDKSSISFKSKKEYCKYFGIEEDSQTIVQWLNHNYGQAEIHMMALAEAIYDAMQESTPSILGPWEFHIPFRNEILVNKEFQERTENMSITATELLMIKISVAKAARVSYTSFNKTKENSISNNLLLFNKLAKSDPFHASPFEHVAQCMDEEAYNHFIKGVADNINEEDPKYLEFNEDNDSKGWCYSLKGFIPMRFLVDNEPEYFFEGFGVR